MVCKAICSSFGRLSFPACFTADSKGLLRYTTACQHWAGTGQHVIVRHCASTGPTAAGVQPPEGNVLLKQFQDQIRMTGPITIHQYMKAVLTHPMGGYYMHGDKVGEKGDFITSPEISQMFGELLGVWVYSEWRKMGSEKPLQLIELGPGRGTLVRDILRVLQQFGVSGDTIHVHLVEISPFYRNMQKTTLCAESDGNGKNNRNGSTKTNTNNVSDSNTNDTTKSSSNIKKSKSNVNKDRTGVDDAAAYGDVRINMNMFPDDGTPILSGTTTWNSPVTWHDQLNTVPSGFSMFLAHEFFDVMPIHQLVKKDGEWREVLVDICGDIGYGGYGDTRSQRVIPTEEEDLGASSSQKSDASVNKDDDVKSSNETDRRKITTSSADTSTGNLSSGNDGEMGFSKEKDDILLRYVLSKNQTPASILYTKDFEGRDSLEYSPESMLMMQQLCARIEATGGALLMVDYGHDGTKGDTFRAYRQHRQQHPLSGPGTADLTADVDFSLLKKAMPESVTSYGPVSQGFFLKNMGIELRLMRLLQNNRDHKQQKSIVSGYTRLIQDLGVSFKMMAVYPSVMRTLLQKFPPPGFFRKLDEGWEMEESKDAQDVKKKIWLHRKTIDEENKE